MKDVSHGEERDALARDWGRFLSQALPGILWWPIPNDPPLARDRLEQLAVGGIILTGGDDWGIFPHRDATEKNMLEWAFQRHVPVLGVCRGAQVINLCLGGCLAAATNHAGVRHPVHFSAQTLEVNSYHCNTVPMDGLAKECRALAVADDATVECFEYREKRLLGMMWHPEREKRPLSADIDLIRGVFGTNA